jgi:predicted RNA binding protein with dsRBD fold (UPF0201 family)
MTWDTAPIDGPPWVSFHVGERTYYVPLRESADATEVGNAIQALVMESDKEVREESKAEVKQLREEADEAIGLLKETEKLLRWTREKILDKIRDRRRSE